jgi:hypothetical protein
MTNFVESGGFSITETFTERSFQQGSGDHTSQFPGGGSNFLRASIALNFLTVYQDPIAVVFTRDTSVSTDQQ